MTVVREAVVLPLLFLAVSLAAGLRPGAPVVLPPPSLFGLVLAALLTGALVQSGAFEPQRVINSSRGTLANANGVVLLGALFFASAQMFSLLTPDSGLPQLVLSVYFLVLMLNTIAAGPDRRRVLRSLAVTFGAAFVLKFVVLDTLSNPAAGRLGRALQVLLDAVTVGALTQPAQHPAAGYLAFGTVVLFLISIWCLPGRDAYDVSGRRAARLQPDSRPRELEDDSTSLSRPSTPG